MSTFDVSAALGIEEADDSWLRPVGHDRSNPVGWTRLGTLDGPIEPIVDRCGVVQVAPGFPGIAWWIAGDDRWYFPSVEKTVRQSLLHNTPIVETRMRVKGGDVCLRTFAVTVPGEDDLRDVVVLEVENSTGVPCGVAFAVRPFGLTEDVAIGHLEIDGGVVTADGRPVLVLPREPAGALSGDRAGGDLVERVKLGEATGSTFAPVDCPDGGAQGVVVVPLAHRNVFRVVLPVPKPDGSFDTSADRFPGAIPPSENVAKGWRAQVRDGARFTVVDPRLQAVCASASPWLLATTNHPSAAIGRSVWDPDDTPRWQHVAATTGALDRLGFHDRAATLLARAASVSMEVPGVDADWLVDGFATHLHVTSDGRFADAVVEACAQIVGTFQADRDRQLPPWRHRRVLQAARVVFDAAGQSAAAKAADKAAAKIDAGFLPLPGEAEDRCDELMRTIIALQAGHGRQAWEILDRYLDEVTSTAVWATDADTGADRHAVGVTAAVICLVSDLFLSADDKGLRLLAHLPVGWSGSSLEATGVSTRIGAAGYAVRWHSDRPAVLWEVADVTQSSEITDSLTVTAPGLDPTWQGHGVSGEALLAEIVTSHEQAKSGSRISGLQIGMSRGGS